MKLWRQLATLGAAAALACSGRPSAAEAEDLVRRYNALVSDAYRAGDFRIAQPAVGDDELRRLAGHIGARLDQGITMDARLLELTVKGVEPAAGGLVVTTDERWHYLDRRIGSGEQVGQDSTDRYAMRYFLTRVEKRWLVDRTEFADKPEVGRTEVPDRGEPRALHGVTTPEQAGTPAPAGAPR